MNWRNRWMFWALVLFVLVLVFVPSIEWLTKLEDYTNFARGWQPVPLKPTRTSFTPRDTDVVKDVLELHSVEFRHKVSKAKSVEVVGDFNAWKPGLLKMKKTGTVTWSLIVPLPAGPHKYLFLVDGEPQVDAKAQTTDGPEGRRVSIRTVK